MPSTSSPRLPVSLVIISHNCAASLADTLRSASWVDDMLVLDSNSSDGTAELAASLGARVENESEWHGFGKKKQQAVQAARHDWVLCLDSDECLTPELSASLQQLLQQPPQHAAYALCRANRFMGRYLRHGEGYPDWCIRLFDRQRAQWSDDVVHERVLVHGSVGRVEGDLLHNSAETLAGYLDKQNRYTSMQAQTLAARGQKARFARQVLSPVVRFIKFYLLRRGFLDGWAGLTHILIGCMNSYLKYAKLQELQQKERSQ